jgi:alpha-galactosidase
MGWNSWDAYGLTIDEADFRANTSVLAGMKQYGWQYAVIDEGWYMEDPFGAKLEAKKYLYDGNGLLLPTVNRFPSSAGGAGFKPLSEWVHMQGLKFGIHVIRGIPKAVVKANLPIAGSSFHAVDAADLTATCPWDDANYGVRDTPAGQAFYDSMMKQYAGWGVDYIKVDCISDHPYRPSEIRQIAEAIRKTGRPIVLSLSPGPTQLEHAAEVAKDAQMWRITDDHWDLWKASGKTGEFPFGLSEEFDRIAAWAPYVKPGSWPDPDMLPEGALSPHPGWGEPRQSRYTQDEQRSEFTLWAISRSPLIFGGNLTKLDAFTRSLMTNKAVLSLNQHVSSSHAVKELPAGFENVRVWSAATGASKDAHQFFAFFDIDDKPLKIHFAWNALGRTGSVSVTNLWDGSKSPASETMDIALPNHGSAVYLVQ